MNSVDVPQAPNLAKLRELVQAVADGAHARASLERLELLSSRHIGYYLHAARILELVDTSMEPFGLTLRGRQLLAAGRGQEAEREVYKLAIEGSSILTQLAPGLLATTAPDQEILARRIAVLTRMAIATARHRAGDLLAWRRDLLTASRPLPFLPATPTSPTLEGVRDSGPDRILPGVLRLRDVTVNRYGPLQHVQAPLQDLTVVVGANAVGKSTLFDVILFVADALASTVLQAIVKRSPNSLAELLWYGQGDSFAFSFDFDLPAAAPRAAGTKGKALTQARYELEIGQLEGNVVGVRKENLFLRPPASAAQETCHRQTPPGWVNVFRTAASGNAHYVAEGGRWTLQLHVGANDLALGHLPGEASKFPVAHSIKDFFARGVVSLALHSAAMRKPVTPLRAGGAEFAPDGANLAHLVQDLAKSEQRFDLWLAHAREALPRLRAVDVVERPEDRHLYLKVTYDDGLQLPSWRLSDGTLRILALTLLSFVAQDAGIFLVEEPENGIHPQAIEAVFQALAAGKGRQVLIATHSPVLLGIVSRHMVLCVSNHDGRAEITPGSRHPALANWQQGADLSVLFATGLL